MALSHHVLVRLAAAQVGVFGFQDYLVLGDDIVISSKEVGESYIALMGKLGVQISKTKTILGGPGIEFASKLLHPSGDFSPLPLGLVLEGRVVRLFSLWTALRDRGVALGANPGLYHSPDFVHSFPLAQKAKGHEELSRLWSFLYLYQF